MTTNVRSSPDEGETLGVAVRLGWVLGEPGQAHRKASTHAANIFTLYACDATTSITFGNHCGRSLGSRDVMKFPSTTTAWFTYSAPALITSSLIADTHVTRRPFITPAEIGTQPA